MNTVDRTEFIKQFIALLRFIAAGEANVGYLRPDSLVIHRMTSATGVDMPVLRPPQEELNEVEEQGWRELNASEYTA
jgi:hypothetical protein